MYAGSAPSGTSFAVSHIKQNNGGYGANSSTNNVVTWGIKKGMTVAKLDSAGNQTDWGWITDISGTHNNTITATIRSQDGTSSAAWTDFTGSSNIIRVYIPVRTGHYMYTVNDGQSVDGYHFIEEITYSETVGAIGSTYKTWELIVLLMLMRGLIK